MRRWDSQMRWTYLYLSLFIEDIFQPIYQYLVRWKYWRHQSPKKHRIAGWWNFLNHIQTIKASNNIRSMTPSLSLNHIKKRSWSRIEAYQFILNHQHSENAGTPWPSSSHRNPRNFSWPGLLWIAPGSTEPWSSRSRNMGMLGLG
jgi:hypothetical protein